MRGRRRFAGRMRHGAFRAGREKLLEPCRHPARETWIGWQILGENRAQAEQPVRERRRIAARGCRDARERLRERVRDPDLVDSSVPRRRIHPATASAGDGSAGPYRDYRARCRMRCGSFCERPSQSVACGAAGRVAEALDQRILVRCDVDAGGKLQSRCDFLAHQAPHVRHVVRLRGDLIDELVPGQVAEVGECQWLALSSRSFIASNGATCRPARRRRACQPSRRKRSSITHCLNGSWTTGAASCNRGRVVVGHVSFRGWERCGRPWSTEAPMLACPVQDSARAARRMRVRGRAPARRCAAGCRSRAR